MSGWRLQIPDCPEELVAGLREALSISDALAQVLVRRGLAEPAAARAFLEGGEEHPPQAFAGIAAAVEVVLERLDGGARITVHGDYDVDGICSTAVLVRALRELGGDVDSYLPDRVDDGYGLSAATVQRLADRGTSLLITADCGITAVEEVELAKSLGLAVVITDHHSPRADGQLPRAPIVHPAVCRYPCPELCAAAVAYKFAQALFQTAGRDPLELAGDLDLVALATVADVVALKGENRLLLRRGLRALARTTKPGLRALMAVAGVEQARVDERAIGYGLAPRLNAAGRLYRADAGLELVLSSDRERAGEIAAELDRVNGERRTVERRIRFEAEAQLAELGERPAYVLAGESWHPGVIGIVASRLVESCGRPVVMVALADGTGKGSGRSIEGFDLLGGLNACSEHLARYGGHRAAAGLELERGRLEEFRAAFEAHAQAVLMPEQLLAVEHVDAIVRGPELTMELAEELARLAPFGRGNRPVNLLVEDARLGDPRPMGEGRHLRFTVESGGARMRAVAFRNGGRLPVPEGEPAQATFSLEINEWRGVSEPRLVLRRARALGAAEAAREPAAKPELPAEPRIEATHPPRPRRRSSQRPHEQELALF